MFAIDCLIPFVAIYKQLSQERSAQHTKVAVKHSIIINTTINTYIILCWFNIIIDVYIDNGRKKGEICARIMFNKIGVFLG